MKGVIKENGPEKGRKVKSVRFSGSFSMATAENNRQVLCSALSGCREAEISFAEVSDIDLAGLQLLCAAHRSAHELDVSLKLSGPVPEHIFAAARRAGFPRRVSCVAGSGSFCIWNDTEADQGSSHE